jgi:predicted NBD/HSP70 family sugar kinase
MGLTLNADRFFLGAARINRNYIAAAVYDLAGTPLVFEQADRCPEDGAEASLSALAALVGRTLARAPGPVIGLGVALPGPFNARTGRITLMSGFPGWAAVDIQKGLRGVVDAPVFLEHDANCGALAELWYGEHRRDENLLYVVYDRGVGAGLIAGGRVYHGASGYAGEIGHTSINFAGPLCECGNRGCLELYASSEALRATYAQASLSAGGDAPSASEILRRVRGGEAAARDAYRRVVGQLAFGVVGLINALNPDCVVFADRMVEGGELFLETVEGVLCRHLMPEVYRALKVSVNRLPGDPMLLGAGVAALDRLLDRPSGAFRRAGVS